MPTPAPRKTPRQNALAKIHIAKKELGLDDDTYQLLLERLFGVTSAAGLSPLQHGRLLAEFQRLGWKPKPARRHPNAHPKIPPNPPLKKGGGEAGGILHPEGGDAGGSLPGWGKDRLIAKIGALLADAGRGWAYADGCARKMFRLESVRFCDSDQLRRIVAALTYDQQRRAKRAPKPPPEAA